jgi:hypothetical protein
VTCLSAIVVQCSVARHRTHLRDRRQRGCSSVLRSERRHRSQRPEAGLTAEPRRPDECRDLCQARRKRFSQRTRCDVRSRPLEEGERNQGKTATKNWNYWFRREKAVKS